MIPFEEGIRPTFTWKDVGKSQALAENLNQIPSEYKLNTMTAISSTSMAV
jgi:hypothetical protein